MRTIFNFVFLISMVGSTFFIQTSMAQTSSNTAIGSETDADLDQIEAEIEKNAVPKQKTTNNSLNKKIDEEKIETFSDLSKLAPFSEVSVIQKRFMPKTGRFQLFGGLHYLANDPWFWGLGLSAKLGYFFTEAVGIELSYNTTSTSEKDSVKDLNTQHGVVANSLINTKSYLGADFIWTPVYGKMSLGNHTIVPFDMYFSIGGGSTSTSDGQAPGTFHLGTGQIFAISKATAFRWDLSWHRFNAKSNIDQSTGSFDNLLITFGLSLFFPEAKYR